MDTVGRKKFRCGIDLQSFNSVTTVEVEGVTIRLCILYVQFLLLRLSLAHTALLFKMRGTLKLGLGGGGGNKF